MGVPSKACPPHRNPGQHHRQGRHGRAESDTAPPSLSRALPRPSGMAGKQDDATISQAYREHRPYPVGPAAIVRVLVRPLTRILNPLMARLAGRRFFPMAQIHHVGRRSGKAYVTPVSARMRGEVLLIGLTFGNQSDWSRNVRAAAGCTVRLGGRTYRAAGPELVDWAADRALVAS